MTDAMIFTETFYGGRIPESQKQVAAVEIIKLVAIVKSDLRREFPEADSDTLDEGVRAVLYGMRIRGAGAPEVYHKQEALAIGAFQQGVTKVRELMTTQAERQEKVAHEQARSVQAETRGSVSEQVFNTFEHHHKAAVSAGYDTPALVAWKHLINNDLERLLDLGDYAYFIIFWRLLQENNIFFNEDVIHICNANPRFPDRKGGASGMKINGEQWRGKN